MKETNPEVIGKIINSFYPSEKVVEYDQATNRLHVVTEDRKVINYVMEEFKNWCTGKKKEG